MTIDYNKCEKKIVFGHILRRYNLLKTILRKKFWEKKLREDSKDSFGKCNENYRLPELSTNCKIRRNKRGMVVLIRL